MTNFDGDLDEWHLNDSLNEEGYRKSMSLILGEISQIFPQINESQILFYIIHNTK